MQQGHNKKLLRLREKLCRLQSPNNNNNNQINRSHIQQIVQKNKATQRKIEDILDMISSHYLSCEDIILSATKSFITNLKQKQTELLQHLNHFKQKQLNAIQGDIEDFLKINRKVKKLISSPSNKSYKIDYYTSNDSVVGKIVTKLNKLNKQSENINSIIQQYTNQLKSLHFNLIQSSQQESQSNYSGYVEFIPRITYLQKHEDIDEQILLTNGSKYKDQFISSKKDKFYDCMQDYQLKNNRNNWKDKQFKNGNQNTKISKKTKLYNKNQQEQLKGTNIVKKRKSSPNKQQVQKQKYIVYSRDQPTSQNKQRGSVTTHPQICSIQHRMTSKQSVSCEQQYQNRYQQEKLQQKKSPNTLFAKIKDDLYKQKRQFRSFQSLEEKEIDKPFIIPSNQVDFLPPKQIKNKRHNLNKYLGQIDRKYPEKISQQLKQHQNSKNQPEIPQKKYGATGRNSMASDQNTQYKQQGNKKLLQRVKSYEQLPKNNIVNTKQSLFENRIQKNPELEKANPILSCKSLDKLKGNMSAGTTSRTSVKAGNWMNILKQQQIKYHQMKQKLQN